MRNIFFKLFNLIIFFLIISFHNLLADDHDPIKNLEKVIGSTFKTLSTKSLNKEDTKNFVLNYAITLEDERGDGLVTYIFDENNYIRYKDFKKISDGAWRFTNLGAMRIFNQDIKLTWKIKLGENNDINIKTKFDPIGKLYNFEYEEKNVYLSKLKNFNEKLEQEKLAAEQKAEEDRKRLEQEKLAAEQKAAEEIVKLQKQLEEQRRILEEEKLYNELEPKYRNKCEKKLLNDLYEIGTPEYKTCILNKGPEKQLEQEKLAAEQKSEEERKRLEQEKLAAEQKAEEDRKRLEQEKLAAEQKAEEEKLKAKKKKLFESVINAKWGFKGIPCDMNGGSYEMYVPGKGFMMWAGGKIQDGGGVSKIVSDINQISETEFVVTTKMYPTPQNKFMYGAIGDRMTAETVRTYKIVNEDSLMFRNEIKMIDVDAVLAGKKGNQVGYTYKTENSERVRCK